MRIAVLQTSPTLGTVNRNIANATALLDRLPPEQLDLIVLPELAFTGYNFTSPSHIIPFVETTTSSPSREWAREVARNRQCSVLIGLPTQETNRHNTAILVDATGVTLHEYHKHHMFETDYHWGCTPGPGFRVTSIPLDVRLVRTSVGICMDLNPREFQAAFDLYEFANFILTNDVELVLLPTAWLLPEEYYEDDRGGPSMTTLTYWIRRLYPLINDARIRTVVIGNRTGKEEGAVYAGTSCAFKVGGGEIQILGVLGRDEAYLTINTSL
jgi:protein N-terminal amidase